MVDHLTKQEAYRMVEKEFGVPSASIQHYTTPSRYKFPSWTRNTRYVKRHIDKYLPQVFNGNPELSLRAISDGIDNLSGIALKERTLEKLLLNYEGLPRGPPIIKSESGNYRLNDSFYKN